MRKHWHTYRPIMRAQEAKAFQPDHVATLADVVAQSTPGAQMILESEWAWYHQDRIVYFIEKGLEVFLENLYASFNLDDFMEGRHEAFTVAWHPDTKLPPMLVEYANGLVRIHYHAGSGTYTIAMWASGEGEDHEFSPHHERYRRLIFGLFIYRHAHPEMISDGFPEDMKERCARICRKGLVGARVLSATDKIRQAPSAHWRTGHYRSLRHERYARNDDGTIRVIWIDGTEVAGKPKTVAVATKE